MTLVFPKYYSSLWLKHFYWQQTNPFGNNIRWVADFKGKIIGHVARIPLLMKIGKETLKGSIAADAATHPDFRSRGIYRKLSELSWKDAIQNDIIVSFADASRMLVSPAQRIGISKILKIAILVKPLNLYEIIKRRPGKGFLAKTILHGAESVLKFPTVTKVCAGAQVKVKELKVRKVSYFDDRIDVFWKRVSDFYGIIGVRNKTYLNWKYFERPHLSFDVFQAVVGETVLGYVVLSTRVEDGLKKGIIVDLLTYPNLTAILKCLTSRAIQHFKETGVSYVECWVFKSNPFHMSLIKQGFFPVPTFLLGADLVARVDSSKVSEAFIKDSMNWYTTQGDYY